MEHTSRIISAVTFLAVSVLCASAALADTPHPHPKPHATARIHQALVIPPVPAVDSRTASADVCGSMLMPAAALKQVSRGFSSYHSGVDLMAPYGSPIRAASAGRVIFAGSYFGYGNMVDLERADGVVTRYAHMSAFGHETRPGHVYAVGEVIGFVGTSGHAHGAHVHFEVRINGRAVDPKPYLALSNCPTGPGRTIEEASAPEPARGLTPNTRSAGSFQ